MSVEQWVRCDGCGKRGEVNQIQGWSAASCFVKEREDRYWEHLCPLCAADLIAHLNDFVDKAARRNREGAQ